jgi:hypothetical protein
MEIIINQTASALKLLAKQQTQMQATWLWIIFQWRKGEYMASSVD